MLHFKQISLEEFLADYWQKKPLLIKQALPNFISPLSANELAGLSTEEEFESRLIKGSIKTQWSLRHGAFSEQDFACLPEKNWTLLLQGVDRYVDSIYALICEFDFIPRWRFDDVMISYATTGGSVGPHFDYYDVFLLQGSGKRRWHLSAQHCKLDNYLPDVPLRIMKKFNAEQTFDVESGDVLYIPPRIAHHGIGLDNNCTTLSFGYRAYNAKELYEFIDKPCPKNLKNTYYQDPPWKNTKHPSLIATSAIKQAQNLLDISATQFAQFVTKLQPYDSQILQNFQYSNQTFDSNSRYHLHPACKIAYLQDKSVQVFINGEEIQFKEINDKILINFCNQRSVNSLHYPELTQQLLVHNLILIM